MFLGTYLLTFSGKGRVVLPKKFRNQLKSSTIFLMKGIDGGIWGFSEEEWEKLSNSQLERSITDRRGRILRRQLFPFAELVELDNQGRFLVSNFLLNQFNSNENLMLIGAGDHFEIWDEDRWKKISKQQV